MARLTGSNPLSYIGVQPQSPTNFITQPRDPTSYDWQNFFLGDEWENTKTQAVWKLVSLAGNQAEWVLITGGSGSTLMFKSGNDSTTAEPADGVITFETPLSNGDGTPAFTASGSTVTLNFTDSQQNVGIGTSVLSSKTTATGNVGLGYNAAKAITTGSDNVCIGYSAGDAITTGVSNECMGNGAGSEITSGTENICIGSLAGFSITSGGQNIAMGAVSLTNLITPGALIGNYNIAIGSTTGKNYATSESSNILLNATTTSVASESNVLRIGNGTGSGNQQLNSAYISGISGVNVGSVASVVSIDSSTNQLGTTTITAGTGISVTPSANAITISNTGTGNILNATVTLTSSQIKNLVGTPITAVSAPGSGFFLNVLQTMSYFFYGGSNAFTNPSSIAISLYYNNNTVSPITQLAGSGTITGTSNSYLPYPGGAGGFAYSESTVENTPFIISIPTGSTNIGGNAANNNTLTVYIQYQILAVL